MSAAKSPPPPADLYAIPCCACTGPHRLVDCDTPRAVELLRAADLPISAAEVQARVDAKRGGAA